MVLNWSVGAFINFAGNGPVYMQRLNASTKMATASFLRQKGALSESELAMVRYEESLRRVNAQRARFIATGAGFAAAAGAAAIAYGVSKAADLQQAMTNVDIATLNIGPKKATRLSPAQEVALRTMAVDVSGMTAQSAVTIANEMATAATSGLNDFKQLTRAFPQIAKLADIMWAQKGADPVNTVKLATQFSHYFGAYSGSPLQHMLDDVYRLMNMQPEHMEQIVKQGKYFIPFASRMGMDEHTLMAYMAIMGQTGLLTGRGGTGMGQTLYHAMNTAALTGALTKAQFAGLTDLGMLDKTGKLSSAFLDSKGAPNLDALMAKLVADRIVMAQKNPLRGPSDFATDLKNAFGVNSTQVLSIIASTISQDRMRIIRETMDVLPGVDEAFHKVSNNFKFQWRALETNIENVFSVTFLPVLPELTDKLVDVNARLRELNRWLAANPQAAREVAHGIMVLTLAFGGIGAFMAGQLVVEAGAASGALQRLALSMDAVAAAGGGGVGGGVRGVAGGAAEAEGSLSRVGRALSTIGRVTVAGSLLFMTYDALMAAIKAASDRDNSTHQNRANLKTINDHSGRYGGALSHQEGRDFGTAYNDSTRYLRQVTTALTPQAFAKFLKDHPPEVGPTIQSLKHLQAIEALMREQGKLPQQPPDSSIHIGSITISADVDAQDAAAKANEFLAHLVNPQHTSATTGTFRVTPNRPKPTVVGDGYAF